MSYLSMADGGAVGTLDTARMVAAGAAIDGFWHPLLDLQTVSGSWLDDLQGGRWVLTPHAPAHTAALSSVATGNLDRPATAVGRSPGESDRP